MCFSVIQALIPSFSTRENAFHIVHPKQEDWEIQQRRTAKIEDEEFDRGFYLREDGGDAEMGNPFLGDEKKFAAKEAEMAKLR